MTDVKKIRLAALAAVCIAGALSLWAFWWEPGSLLLNQECIALNWTLQRALRVAVLTDLHVGSPFNGLSKLREIVVRTNAAGADAVFILGDFVVHGVLGATFVPPEEIARELGKLTAPARCHCPPLTPFWPRYISSRSLR